MSLSHSPRVITDGLVFAYDMQNTRKSWKGAPTTNLLADRLSATNATRSVLTGPFHGTYNGWQATGVSSDNPRVTLFNGSIAVSASTFYTLSCLYWSSNNVLDDVYLKFSDTGWPESTYYIQPFTSQATTRGGSYSVTDLGGGWKYCVGSFQTLSTTTTLQQLFFDVDIAGAVVFITNLQLEQQATATPFVNGTRSNTQAILDMVGSKTITANNLVYNTGGTFSFDGSSSWINAGTDHPSVSEFTIECTVNAGSSQVTYAGIVGNHVEPYKGMYCQQEGNALNRYNWGTGNGSSWGNISVFTLPTGAWAHVALVKSPTTNNTYLNGALVASVATNGDMALSGNNVGFGRDYITSPRYFNGLIANGRIYNRALSAAEVQQNFNALRGRYGI